MSAIDEYIIHMTNHVPGHATLTINARTELVALRARIAELEARASMWREQTVWTQEILDDELEAATVVTPRQCNRKCFKRGWKAAQDAAAKLGDDKAINAANNIRSNPLSAFVLQDYADDIRALTPPDDCADCNPLASDAPRPLSLVEIAAYHWYLADDDAEMMLSSVFDDMTSDEREQYITALK